MKAVVVDPEATHVAIADLEPREVKVHRASGRRLVVGEDAARRAERYYNLEVVDVEPDELISLEDHLKGEDAVRAEKEAAEAAEKEAREAEARELEELRAFKAKHQAAKKSVKDEAES